MAGLVEDIRKKIINDFGKHSSEAIDLIEKFSVDYSDLAYPRIFRCAVYSAKGNLDVLLSALSLAVTDYRDLILAGEYENSNGKDIQVRDLEQPFS